MSKSWKRTTTRELDAVLALPGLPPPPRSRLQTVEDLLEQSKRSAAPIRRSFVQIGRGSSSAPGPLSSFARAHDARALDAFLLLHAVASQQPWDCTYPSRVWVRALGLQRSAERGSAQAAVSKIIRRLVDRRLVSTHRKGRLSSITLLCEDGSGDPYDRPRTKDDPWFNLPHEFWSKRLSDTLSLAGKTMYLIALSLGKSFYLPYERATDWYGISPKTAQRGLSELVDLNVLSKAQGYAVDVRSETGWTVRIQYTHRDLNDWKTEGGQ